MKKFVTKKVVALPVVRFGNATLHEISTYEESLREFLNDIPNLTVVQIKEKTSQLSISRPKIFKQSVKKESDRWGEIKDNIKKSEQKDFYKIFKDDMKLVLKKIEVAYEIVTAISEALHCGKDLSSKINQLSEKPVTKGSFFRGSKPVEVPIIHDFKQSTVPVLSALNLRLSLHKANESIRTLDSSIDIFNEKSLDILDNKKITCIDSVNFKLQGSNFSGELAAIQRRYSDIVGNGKVDEGMAFYRDKIKAFEGRLVLLEHMKEAIAARQPDSDAASTASSDKSSKLSVLPGKAEFDAYPNKVRLAVLQDLFYEALAKHKPSQAKPSPVGYLIKSGSVPTSQSSVSETHKRPQTASMLASSVSNDSGSVSHTTSGSVLEMLSRLDLKIETPLLKELVPLKESAQVDIFGLADKISGLVDSVDSTKTDELLAIVTHVLTNGGKENTQYRRLCCRILGEFLALGSTDIPDGANLTVLERKHIAFQLYYVLAGRQCFDDNAVQTADGKEALSKAGLSENFEMIAAKTPLPVTFSLSSVNSSPSSVIGVPMVVGDLETSLQLRPGSISVSQNGPLISPHATASSPISLRGKGSAFSSRGTNLGFSTVDQLDAKPVSQSGSRSASVDSNKSVEDDVNASLPLTPNSSPAPSSEKSVAARSQYATPTGDFSAKLDNLNLDTSVHSTTFKKSSVAASASASPSPAPVEAVSERPAGRNIVLNRSASPLMGAVSESKLEDDVPVKAGGSALSYLRGALSSAFTFSSAPKKPTIVAPENAKILMKIDVQGLIPAKFPTYEILGEPTNDTIPGFKNKSDSDQDGGLVTETQGLIKALVGGVGNSLTTGSEPPKGMGDALFTRVNDNFKRTASSPELILVLLNADTSTNIGAKARVLGVCLLARLAAEGHQVSYHTDQFSDAEKLIFVLQKNATHQKNGETRGVDASLEECFGINLVLFLDAVRSMGPVVVESISRSNSTDLMEKPALVVFEDTKIPEELFPKENISVREGAQQKIGKETYTTILSLYNSAIDTASSYEDSETLAKAIHEKTIALSESGTSNLGIWIDNLPEKETKVPEDRVRRLIGIRMSAVLSVLNGGDRSDSSMTPAENVLYQAQIAASNRLSESSDLFAALEMDGITQTPPKDSSVWPKRLVPPPLVLNSSGDRWDPNSSLVKSTPSKGNPNPVIKWRCFFAGVPKCAEAGKELKTMGSEHHKAVAEYLGTLPDPAVIRDVLLAAEEYVLISSILNKMELSKAIEVLNAVQESPAKKVFLQSLTLTPELCNAFPSAGKLEA